MFNSHTINSTQLLKSFIQTIHHFLVSSRMQNVPAGYFYSAVLVFPMKFSPSPHHHLIHLSTVGLGLGLASELEGPSECPVVPCTPYVGGLTLNKFYLLLMCNVSHKLATEIFKGSCIPRTPTSLDIHCQDQSYNVAHVVNAFIIKFKF